MDGYQSVGRYLVENGPVYFMKDGKEEMGNLVAKKGNDAKIQLSNGKTMIANYQRLYTYTNPDDLSKEVSDFGQMGGRRKKTKKNKTLKRKTMRRKH